MSLFIKKRNSLVVSRYNEDLTWTHHDIFSNFKIYVYDKSGRNQLIFIKNSTIEFLPNVGREIHSYIYHIIKYYNSLEDMTYLCQGDPLEQCPDLFERIENNKASYIELNSWETECDDTGYPDHPGLSVRETYEYLFETPFPGKIDFNPSSMYGLSKQIIKSRTLEFYQRALAWLETRASAPWEMERMLRHIWKPTKTSVNN
jgi:hypothetical protein